MFFHVCFLEQLASFFTHLLKVNTHMCLTCFLSYRLTAFNLCCLVHARFSPCEDDLVYASFFATFLFTPVFCLRPLYGLVQQLFRLWWVWSLSSLPCSLPFFSVCKSSGALCHMMSLYGLVYAPFPGCGRSAALFTPTLQGMLSALFRNKKTILSNSFFVWTVMLSGLACCFSLKRIQGDVLAHNKYFDYWY